MMKGTPLLTGRALTNDLCSQYFKINFFIPAQANLFISAKQKLHWFWLTLR